MDAGKLRQDECTSLLLVGRVHEGEQVTNGDGLHAGGFEFLRCPPHRGAIERNQHIAEIVGALGDLACAALRRDRNGLLVEVIERIAVTGLSRDFLDRAVALGDQEPDTGPTHFKERIGGDGGAVGEEIDLRGIDAPADEIRDAVEHACGRIARGARHFLHQQRPGGHVVQHEIRVGAADIDADPIARHYADFSPTIMALTPPSTNSMLPVMNSESPDTRNSTARAISSGTPGRPIRFTTGRVGSNSSLPTGEPILFGTTPLTRIRYGASCTAMARVRLATPPLAAEYATARERP